MNEIARRRGKSSKGATPPAPTVGDMALAHRYRFAAPLRAGRTVIDLATPSDPSRHPEGAIVLALVAMRSAEALEKLPLLASGETLVLALSDAADATLRAALAARFRTIAVYFQRPVLGSLIAPARFAASRIAALADAPADGDALCGCSILVCGQNIPDLATGLFEATLPLDHRPDIAPPPPISPAIMAAGDAPPVPRPDAVSLVERLLDLDGTIFTLNAENRALREQLAADGAAQAAVRAAAEPRITDETNQPTVSWPLLEYPDTPAEEIGLYERRPDDDLVASAMAGNAFLERHGLLTATPDFTGAVAALNAAPPLLRLAPLLASEAPDVSIVIPVYGQLAYTLNCLDALLNHASAYSAEIIVVDDVSPDATGLFLPAIAGIRGHRKAANGGFVAACNTGAALARGRFIVLLNNDTRPLPGWLDELIDSFSLFPKAGLVGSKLLYPDGTLQEAGGIVWRDGSAWNIGRGDDPNRPRYCHARQVDYVSGAAIALPAALWRDLGGLDTLYAPAYYEDTDIAFRVRARGWQVWMQATSRVIHYEGRTSGTDVASGVKAYQVVNRGKFFYRWRDTLLRHGDPGPRTPIVRARMQGRGALLLDDTTPTPRQDAGSNYSLLTLRLFLALGYRLAFVPQDNFLFQRGHTPDLQRIGIDCIYAPYFHDTDAYLRSVGSTLDLVMVSRMQVLERVIDELQRHAPQAPIMFNTHDLNFLRMRRSAEIAGDPAMLAAADLMRDRELALMRRVDCIVTPSAFEAQILTRELPGIETHVLPIMTDLEGTDIGFEARRDVCYLGGYRHPPNIDAVMYFVDEIFPRLKAEEPYLRFIIAGAHPTPAIRALASEDIIVTGQIDDLRDVLDRVRVFVCPLRVGAGAKGKLASAMSYGVPIVSTSIGVEGMDFVDGEEVLVADGAAEFAQACLDLYRDRALWERISAASMALVSRVTSAEARERIFTDAIDAAWHHKLGI